MVFAEKGLETPAVDPALDSSSGGSGHRGAAVGRDHRISARYEIVAVDQA
jgi:hypothetical protein